MGQEWTALDKEQENQMEIQRQENLVAYGEKISGLKAQEIELKNSINNLKSIIDIAQHNRIQELNEKENDLKGRLAEADDLNLKAKDLNKEYELKLAALAIETNTFETYRKDKQDQLDRTTTDIENQKTALAGQLSIHEVNVTELDIKNKDHALSIDKFNEQSILIEGRKKEAEDLLSTAKEELAKVQPAKDEASRLLVEANAIKDDYLSKNSALDAERVQLKVLQDECSAKVDRLNKEKAERDLVNIQLKSDRIELDKKMEVLSQKQAEINIQTEKLEALKASVIKES